MQTQNILDQLSLRPNSAESRRMAKELGIRRLTRQSPTSLQMGLFALIGSEVSTGLALGIAGEGLAFGLCAIGGGFCSLYLFLKAIPGSWDLYRLGILFMLITGVMTIMLNIALIVTSAFS